MALQRFGAQLGEMNYVMMCPDCGHNYRYMWKYDHTDTHRGLRDGITIHQRSLTFDKVKDEDFTKYLCAIEKQNQMINMFKLELVEKG